MVSYVRQILLGASLHLQLGNKTLFTGLGSVRIEKNRRVTSVLNIWTSVVH